MDHCCLVPNVWKLLSHIVYSFWNIVSGGKVKSRPSPFILVGSRSLLSLLSFWKFGATLLSFPTVHVNYMFIMYLCLENTVNISKIIQAWVFYILLVLFCSFLLFVLWERRSDCIYHSIFKLLLFSNRLFLFVPIVHFTFV